MVRDRSLWAVLLLPAALAVLLFAGTLAHPFIYDDVYYIEKNPAIRSIAALPRAFLSPFHPAAPGLYRPLTTASYALDFALGGLRPGIFHASNILLHAAATAVFSLLALRLLRNPLPALLAGAIFAAHPVHTEAVTWVSGRSELLAAVFVFLVTILFLRSREEGGSRAHVFLALSALAYMLALLGKEVASPLPLMLLVFALLLPPRTGEFGVRALLRSLGVPALAFGIALLLSLMLRFAALGALSVPLAHARTAGLSFLERMSLMLPIIAHELRLMVFPLGLRVEYDWTSFSALTIAASAALIAAVLGTGWCARRKMPLVAAGIAWFFLFLLPTANIVPIGELIAERFLYLPSAGFCLALGALALWIQEHSAAFRIPPARLRAAWCTAFALILLPFAFLTIQRNAEWRDPETLWRSTLALSPAAPKARENLAVLLLARGELEAAGMIIQAELQRFPEKPMLALLAGQWHAELGDAAEAQAMFERSLALGHPGDIEFDDFQRGSVLLRLQRFAEALDPLLRARESSLYDPAILNNLGIALAQVGRREEAVTAFTEALRLFKEQGTLSEEDQRNFAGAEENLRMLQDSL